MHWRRLPPLSFLVSSAAASCCVRVAEQGFSCLLLSAQLLATVVFLQFCRSMNPAL
jgi:hypothetical protein